MTKHIITIPEPMDAYVGERLADGRYASLSEYVSDLVVQDMMRRSDAERELRDILDAAENSGLSERDLEDIFKYARSLAPKATSTD